MTKEVWEIVIALAVVWVLWQMGVVDPYRRKCPNCPTGIEQVQQWFSH